MVVLSISSNPINIKHYIDWLIGWCLMPIFAIFQLYQGVNKFYKLISTTTGPLERNIYLWARSLTLRNTLI